MHLPKSGFSLKLALIVCHGAEVIGLNGGSKHSPITRARFCPDQYYLQPLNDDTTRRKISHSSLHQSFETGNYDFGHQY